MTNKPTATHTVLTCSAFPTQVEGELDTGRAFYFRARHGWWSLTEGSDARDAIFGQPVADGVDPSLGQMAEADVLEILREHYDVSSIGIADGEEWPDA